MNKSIFDEHVLRNFCSEARVILAKEDSQRIDLFCEGFCSLAADLERQMAVATYDILEGQKDFSLPVNAYAEYDGSQRALRVAKDAEKLLKLLERLLSAPEFEKHTEVLFETFRVVSAQLIERYSLRPKGRPRQPKRDLVLLNLLDTALALCLPHLSRVSYGPTTKAGQLAEALLGKRPPKDLRERLDQIHWYSPDDENLLSNDDGDVLLNANVRFVPTDD